MKKTTNLLIALATGIGIANAGPVTLSVAQKAAINFYVQTSAKVVTKTTVAYTENDAAGIPLYYVLNVNDKDGFVVITAEDAARPIIGYSTNGQWVIPAKGTNIEYWMNLRKKELINIRANNLNATTEIAQEWSGYINNKASKKSMSGAVGPLCQSTWDQQYSPYPYNYFCPPGLTGSMSTSNQSVTGCVATTMSQIMRYWSYPAKGTGSHSYCDCSSGGYS
ncbi:MAG TPA: Spi family protease inhibitor, partial [Bacteroidia bacterium]|nr:Spi family protease inhibitor [Bacteroidia bacterium]